MRKFSVNNRNSANFVKELEGRINLGENGDHLWAEVFQFMC